MGWPREEGERKRERERLTLGKRGGRERKRDVEYSW